MRPFMSLLRHLFQRHFAYLYRQASNFNYVTNHVRPRIVRSSNAVLPFFLLLIRFLIASSSPHSLLTATLLQLPSSNSSSYSSSPFHLHIPNVSLVFAGGAKAVRNARTPRAIAHALFN